MERGADPNAKELVLLAARCRYPCGASHPATPFVFCPFRLGVSTRCTLLHSTKRTASVAPDCCSLPVRGLTCTGCVPFLFRQSHNRLNLPPHLQPLESRTNFKPLLSHWQYSMTPLDYARWRNRTALAALLETEASARGLTNATRSDEPN